MWQNQQQTSLRGGPSSGSCPKRYGRQRSGSSSCCASTTSWKRMPTCCRSWLTSPCWPRSPTPRPLTWSWKAAAQLMIQVNIPEHYLSPVQDPPLKTTAEECLSRLEKVILPWALVSHTGTTVQTHQASSCSGLAPISNASFSMAAPPRKLALCLRCEPNNCQSCCWVRFTFVDPLELPRANISSLTLQPMREMWLVVMSPPSPSPPPPRSKCHCHQQ